MVVAGASWRWTWATPLPAAILVGALAALAAATAWALWRGRHAPLPRLRAALRIAAALAVATALGQPALQQRRAGPGGRHLTLILDDSASMAQAAAGAESRWQRACAALGAAPWRQRAAGLRLLGRGLTAEMGLPPAAAAAPTGAESDLVAAVAAAIAPPDQPRPAGILLISDGIDHGALGAGEEAADALAGLAAAGVPVNTLWVDDPAPVRDVAVARLQAPQLAFVRSAATLTAHLRQLGFTGAEVDVELWRDGQRTQARRVRLESGGQTVDFVVRPERQGEFIYEVTVAPLPQESNRGNNRQAAVLTVARDRTRVLHVAGHPHWDARFLRAFLKAQPNIELVSFFILRTPTSDARVPEGELSLIPFPAQQLFENELPTFDVVVLQGLDPRPFGLTPLLRHLVAAVREHGVGLAVTGGDRSLGAGGWVGTELAELSPCLLADDDAEATPVSVVPTAAAASHPLTAGWAGDIDPGWPAWEGHNRAAGLRPGAQVLLAAAGAGGAPLLAAGELGLGRTMAVMSGGMWRWRFGDAAAGSPAAAGRAWARLWGQALRYLAHDPETAQVTVEVAQRQLRPGERQHAWVRVRDAQLKPRPGATVALALQTGSGTTRAWSSTCDDQGVAEWGERVDESGVWRLTVRPEGAAGSQQASWVVAGDGGEAADLLPTQAPLGAISAATGGAALRLSSGAGWPGRLRLAPPAAAVDDQVRWISLWDTPWFWALAVCLWASEWMLRRRVGLA